MPLSKGHTNNHNGRPKKNRTLTELLARYGNKTIEKQGSEFNGMKAKDALAKRLWQLAIYDKELPAIKYIFDRIDGRPIETLRAEIDRGDISVIKTLQKELFNVEELEETDAGTLEAPEEASTGA